MALSGDLKDFGLLQLITLVQVTEKTGALTLQRARETAIVYFENGRLTKVVPPETRYEGLATALHRAGRIGQELYELLCSQGLPSEKAVGLMAVDQGSLSQDEIVEFVRERSLAGLFLLLTWSEGTFRFDVGTTPSEGDILAPTELAPVLDMGRAYLQEWQVLVSQIPDLDRSVRLVVEPLRPAQEICISLPEWKMVAALAGSDSLRQVAQKLGLDDFAVRQVAYRLFGAGLMEVVERKPSPVQAPTEILKTAAESPASAPPGERFERAAQREPSLVAADVQEPQQPKSSPLGRFFGRK